MSLDFYDRNGNPIAYSDDGEHIFTFRGKAAGYLYNGSVYAYSGKHLGRFVSGLIRDHGGNVAFFTAGATGGPVKPVKKMKPLKAIKQLKPLKGVRAIPPVKRVNTLKWSATSGPQFFG